MVDGIGIVKYLAVYISYIWSLMLTVHRTQFLLKCKVWVLPNLIGSSK